MLKSKVMAVESNPDQMMLQEIADRLRAAREKVWEAQREQADTVYEATKFIYERGWYECLKIDESKLRRMARR